MELSAEEWERAAAILALIALGIVCWIMWDLMEDE
jgi:hypothetical protein